MTSDELERRARSGELGEVSVTLRRFAWIVLAYNLAVILWGAYVRATGSGAGCGSHWPLCNGTIVQPSPTAATIIEYSHRLTSGLALVLVAALAGWTFRVTPKGHPARRGAAAAVFFMLTEAALGAGLVLFRLVADNATMARAMFVAAHLVNTFILLEALTLTAWWLEGRPRTALGRRPVLAGVLIVLGLGVLLTGASGAVAALGDTLYPSGSFAEGLRADLSATSHAFIRLRVWHPAIAVTAGALVLLVTPRLVEASDTLGQRLGRALIVAVGVQLIAGLLNVLLAAPIWMQMAHLLIADLVWITYVLFSAQLLRADV
jgi:heme A synthase